MAIIIGGNPRVEREKPVALPENEVHGDVAPVEEKEAVKSEEPEAEVKEVKTPVKRAKKNGKKKA